MGLDEMKSTPASPLELCDFVPMKAAGHRISHHRVDVGPERTTSRAKKTVTRITAEKNA